MRSLIVVGALGVAGLVWSGVAAQVYREPNPGPGVVTVTGTVQIGNHPSVNAAQKGDWNVAVANVPDVRVTNTASVALVVPEFLKSRARYAVVWPNGDREIVVVEQIGRDGWVRVERKEGRRWINAAAARSFEVSQ